MRRGGSQQRCFFHITDKHEAISPFNLLTFQAPILNHPLDTSGRVGLALSFIVLQVFNKALSCTSCLLSVKSAADYNRWQKKERSTNKIPFYWTSPLHNTHTLPASEYYIRKIGPFLWFKSCLCWIHRSPGNQSNHKLLPTSQPLLYLRPWLLRFLLHMNRGAVAPGYIVSDCCSSSQQCFSQSCE